MKKVDFHTHIFPENIAAAALDKLSTGGGGIPYYTSGTPHALTESMLSSAVDVSVAMNIATTPAQQTKVNDFAAYVNSDEIICFGSVHPDAPDAQNELERIRELGLPGVKFHLDCQNFEYDHPALRGIYRKIAELGLIVCFHTGWDMSTGFCRMTPGHMLKTLPLLEGVPVIASHFGAYAMWDECLDTLCGLDLYFDTSFSCGRIPPKVAEKIIEKHGIDKILFGSDSPWGKQQDEAAFVELLDLSENDRKKIFYQNAEKLLKRNI